MRFHKIPNYLRYSIEDIMADARKKISVHYLHTIVHAAGRSGSKGGTGCQIMDTTDYGAYFYEPKKYTLLPQRTIRSLDQRSAHQNAIIAFKKWEEEVRAFLTNPEKNHELPTRRKEAISHTTHLLQVQ